MSICTVGQGAATSSDSCTDPELVLLGTDPVAGGFDGGAYEGLKNAPILTGDALETSGHDLFPQRALYGRVIAQECEGFPTTVRSPKIYINTNVPFSGITCGVQGSGKSHSTSVLLESCLIPDARLGTLPAPLGALLFHFDTAAANSHTQPCEAAYLASLDEIRGANAKPPKVTIVVMPNSLPAMKRVYAGLPEVTVEPLRFAPDDLSGERLLAMMKVEQEQQMPLYMECIMNILRSMETFDYTKFRQKLSTEQFLPMQKSMLNLRLGLIDSCLEGGNISNRVSNHFKKGQLTIIDLSSPFMDASSACGFFDIILGLFIEARTEAVGKIVVLDEAHKYLTNGGSSSRLTDSLLSVVRQQRHLGTRVLISTQEPTIIPSQFLELCSFVIAHRFSSPRWLEHLKKFISIADDRSFTKIFTLRSGEAMLFSPAGVGLRGVSDKKPEESICAPFGRGYLLVRSRERITRDAGRSLLAAAASGPLTRQLESIKLSDRTLEGGQATLPASHPHKTVGNVLSLNSPRAASASATTNQTEIPKLSAALSAPVPIEKVKTPAVPSKTFVNGAVPPSVSPAQDEIYSVLKDVDSKFKPLVNKLATGRMSWTDLETELKQQQPSPFEGKLQKYLERAAAAGVIELSISPKGERWAQLCDYIPLVKTLRRLRDKGDTHLRRSIVSETLQRNYPKALIKTFKHYAEGAEAAGVIKYDTKMDRILLLY